MTCGCGHEKAAHDHYRRGTDCGHQGCGCERFRPANRCPGRVRHWRVTFGTVGLRTPVCVFCGSPNPKPLTCCEWDDLLDWARDHSVGDHVRTAIEQRTAVTP